MEHCLFSEIYKHWAEVALEVTEIILKSLHYTTIQSGLTVTADVVKTVFDKGAKTNNQRMTALIIPQ